MTLQQGYLSLEIDVYKNGDTSYISKAAYLSVESHLEIWVWIRLI